MPITIAPHLADWKTFETDLGTLAYFERGADRRNGAPTVVLIHGINSAISFWMSQIDPFFRELHVVSLSLPGHYPAAFAPQVRDSDLTPERLIDSLSAAVHALGGERVALVGHSTGGWAALGIAARAPQRVMRVLTVSAFARGRWGGILGVGHLLARYAPPLYRAVNRFSTRSEDAFQSTLDYYVTDRAATRAHPHYEVNRLNYPFFTRTRLHDLARWFRVMPDIDTIDWFTRISAPVTLIHGAADHIVPVSEGRRVASAIPGAVYHELPGVGHVPMLEGGMRYDSLVEAWADDVRRA